MSSSKGRTTRTVPVVPLGSGVESWGIVFVDNESAINYNKVRWMTCVVIMVFGEGGADTVVK
ncbi:hypothetical protein [Bacillus timonensis]|uniref:hypothetical protein n=1 Tax=Bacillus timonensis TaxID=1033734 RepID=UPI000289C1EC|nr:hypothetical protein [Bacillus timonensis]